MFTSSMHQKWGKSVILLTMVVFLIFLLGINQKKVRAVEITLRPPFNYLPNGSTFRVTSYFDHYYPNYVSDPDNPNITVYTGETTSAPGDTTDYDKPYSYRGHPGYDFSMNNGTEVLAAADGTAFIHNENNSNYGFYVCVQHSQGFYTLYAHLSRVDVVSGQPVTSGQRIGLSGQTGTTGAHLHFAVQRSTCDRSNAARLEYDATDPFGWRGESEDPLASFSENLSGEGASCLWRSSDEDPVSCADTIYEDGAQGHALSGSWNFDRQGNGFHRFSKYNSSSVNEISEWKFDVPSTRPAKVYAWIPPATTEHATYGIWTAYGWEYVTISQNNNTDRWVLLGTFIFNHDPINNYVVLWANTGEPVNTKTVGVDAIKFRSYQNILPIINNQIDTTPTAIISPTRTPTPAPNPLYSTCEPNDTVEEWNNLSQTNKDLCKLTNSTKSYYLYHYDHTEDADVFKFTYTTPQAGATITFYLENIPLYSNGITQYPYHFEIYNGDGTWSDKSSLLQQTSNGDWFYSFVANPGATYDYYIRVYSETWQYPDYDDNFSSTGMYTVRYQADIGLLSPPEGNPAP